MIYIPALGINTVSGLLASGMYYMVYTLFAAISLPGLFVAKLVESAGICLQSMRAVIAFTASAVMFGFIAVFVVIFIACCGTCVMIMLPFVWSILQIAVSVVAFRLLLPK